MANDTTLKLGRAGQAPGARTRVRGVLRGVLRDPWLIVLLLLAVPALYW